MGSNSHAPAVHGDRRLLATTAITDEPYDRIGHVRVCGGRRVQARPLPGRDRRMSASLPVDYDWVGVPQEQPLLGSRKRSLPRFRGGLRSISPTNGTGRLRPTFVPGASREPANVRKPTTRLGGAHRFEPLRLTGFWFHHRELPEPIRELADKNFQLLKVNPRHPSIRLKKLGSVWSARVDRSPNELGCPHASVSG
jgi:hypothetical protein